MTLFEWRKFLPGNRNKSPEQIAEELKQKLKKQKPEGPLKNYPVFEYPYTREQVICNRELAKDNLTYLTQVRADRIKIVSDFFQSFGFDICQLAASPNPNELLEAIKNWGAKFWSPESNRPTNYATAKREDSLKHDISIILTDWIRVDMPHLDWFSSDDPTDCDCGIPTLHNMIPPKKKIGSIMGIVSLAEADFISNVLSYNWRRYLLNLRKHGRITDGEQ